MKYKKRQIVLGSLSIFFALFSLLWLQLIGPNLLKLPKDFNFSAQIVSRDNLYDVEKNDYQGEIFSKTSLSYQTLASDVEKNLIQNKFEVKTPDDQPIFSVERLYSIDRETLTHTQGGDKKREGYLFAPKNLKKGESFIYWHINYDGPATMNYIGEENLYELSTHHYESNYEGVKIDQTENLSYLPEVGKTKGIVLKPHLELWVEPVTGRLIKYKDDTVAYYYDLKSGQVLYPWNHFSNTFNETSVVANVQKIMKEKILAHYIQIYIPIFLGIVSLIFLMFFFKLEKRLKSWLTKERINIFLIFILILCPGFILMQWVIKTDVNSLGFLMKMNPLTAICFLILSGGFFAKMKNLRLLTYCTSGVISTIAIIKLGGILNLWAFQIDQVLFAKKILLSPSPSKMATFTAICFILIALALIISESKRFKKFHFAEILSGIIAILSFIILGSYLLELRFLLNNSLFYFVSLPTAALFFISSLGSLLLFKEEAIIKLKIKEWLIIFSILAFCILTTVILSNVASSNISSESKLNFEFEAEHMSESIAERLDIYSNILQGAKGFLNASELVSREEWKVYVESLELEKNYPGVQGLGYSIFISPEEKEGHIKAIQSEGFPEYKIKPEGERDIYTSIIYIEPFNQKNRQAFGYDMFSNETRRIPMQKAMDSGRATISDRITLVQEIDKNDVQPGFLMYVPVYKKNSPTTTTQERRANIIGYVYSAFRARDFMEAVIENEPELEEISFALYDNPEKKPEDQLFDNTSDFKGEETSLKTSEVFYVAGKPWFIDFVSKPNYGLSFLKQINSLIIISIGLFISFLITFTVYTLISSRQRAEIYAQEVNHELKKTNDDLRKTQKLIVSRAKETDRMNKLMIDRELKMIELKEKYKNAK